MSIVIKCTVLTLPMARIEQTVNLLDQEQLTNLAPKETVKHTNNKIDDKVYTCIGIKGAAETDDVRASN